MMILKRWTVRILLVCAFFSMLLLTACDKLNSDDGAGHEHTLVRHEGKEPSCLEGGYKAYETCSECEYTTYTDIPAPGHVYYSDNYIPYGDVHSRFCKNCSEAIQEPHDWQTVGEYLAPTCTEDGMQSYVCSVCEVEKTETFAALNHDFSSAPVNNGDNHKTTCKSCTESVTAPHTWDDGETVRYATCTVNGETKYTCTDCGATRSEEITASGHDYTSKPVPDGDDHKIICKNCTDFVTYPHVWDEGEVLTDATCTKEGEKKHVCKDCEATKTEVIAVIDHDCTDATCTAAKKCNFCGTEFGEPLGHLNDIILEAKDATCTEAGITEGACCSRCRAVTVTQTIIPAFGHDLSSTVTAPTCNKIGYTTHNCSVCGYEYVDGYVSALGHTYLDATCEDSPTCAVCGYWDGRPLGHDFAEATCTSPKTCKRAGCGYTEGTARGHDMTAATCTAPKICKNGCGLTEGTALGHNMTAASCDAPATCLNGCGLTEGEKLVHTVRAAYSGSTVTYICDKCSIAFNLDNQKIYLDGSDYVGMTGSANGDRDYATNKGTHQPIITDEGYYKLLKATTTEEGTQFQIWFPKDDRAACDFSSENNSVGFLSFKINAYVDDYLQFKLVDGSSSGGRWSADWCITKEVFSITPPKQDGDKLYVTVKGVNNKALMKIEVTEDDLFTGWLDVAMGIVLDPVTDSVIIHYYINGEFITKESTPLTIITNAINSVYLTGYTKTSGSGIMLDDISFGYSTNSTWVFDQHDHVWSFDRVVAPECEVEGYTVYKCDVCSATRNLDFVPAIGHDYADEYLPNGDVHSRFCSRCDSAIDDEEHSIEIIEVLLDPTCGEDGLVRFYCSVCNTTAVTTTPATGDHKGDFTWAVTKEPTAFEPGRESLLCSDCNRAVEERDVPAEVYSMPIIYLTGEYQNATSAKNEVKMGVEFVDPDGLSFTSYATIKVQGSSSVAYPKKNYTIKFYKDEDCSKKYKVDFGWGKESKYVMKANWVDYTNARNVVSCRLWKDMVSTRPDSAVKDRLIALQTNAGAIDGFAIAVFMNGEFYGLYTMNVPKDEWMFGMDDSETEALICADNWNSTNFSTTIEGFYEKSDGDIVSKDGGWELRYCGSDDYSWVADSFNNLILFCQENDGEAFREGISQYLDVDAAIDYLIFMYANGMRDNASKNMLWATYDGNVWIPSVYDQDGTFGQSWDGVNALSANAYLPYAKNGEANININYGASVPKYILWEKIFNCFTEEVLLRYQELRLTTLSTENIIAELQAFENSVPDSIYEADRLVWAEERESWWEGKRGSGVWYEKYNFEYMYVWVELRMQYFDAAMLDIYNNVYLPKTDNPAL